MMSHLVSNDVGISKVTTSPEIAVHLGKERGIDINGFFSRKIKWSHPGIGDATGIHTSHAIVVHELGNAIF